MRECNSCTRESVVWRRGTGALAVFAAALAVSVVGATSNAYADRGALFVSNFISRNVSVYPRTVSSTVPPTRVITDGLNGPHEVTVNSKTKELVVANNLSFAI